MRGAKWTRVALGALACAAITATALTGCTSERPTAGVPDPGLRGQWVFVSGQDRYGSIALRHQNISLTVTASPTITGRGSCTDYTASVLGSERSLWVTTKAASALVCASADQAVLQLEYLDDLAAVQRSSVTSAGLELVGPRVDLHFARAVPLDLSTLASTSWVLRSGAKLDITGAATPVTETGAFLTFQTSSDISAATNCDAITARYSQNAGEVVQSHIHIDQNNGCDIVADQAATDLTGILGAGYTYRLTGNHLVLTSQRAGIELSFDQLRAP